jgi:hypothetical protein
MSEKLEIHGPLDDLAALEALGLEIRRTGESIWAELGAEAEARKVTARIGRWRRAAAAAEAKNPNDKRLIRAQQIISELEMELSGWRLAHLAAWRPDRTKPN